MSKCVLVYNNHNKRPLTPKIVYGFEQVAFKKEFDLVIIRSNDKDQVANLLFDDITYGPDDNATSIGGDGTFYNLVNSTKGSGITLSHLPFGTTNDIQKIFGFRGNNIVKNFEQILTGEEKQLDIPMANGTPWAYSFGAGKLLNIPYTTTTELKKRLGHSAYVLKGAQDLFTKPVKPIHYICNSKEYTDEGDAAIILFSNQSGAAGFNNMIAGAVVDDGLYEVSIFKANNNREIIKAVIMLLRDQLIDNPNIIRFSSDNVKMNFEQDYPFCIDGEYYPLQTKEIQVNMSQRKVLVPTHRFPDQFRKI